MFSNSWNVIVAIASLSSLLFWTVSLLFLRFGQSAIFLNFGFSTISLPGNWQQTVILYIFTS